MRDQGTRTGFEYDVYLSYSSKDRPQVLRLAERLRAAGLRVWFDQWSIKPGDDIYLAMERGLDAARKLVLFLSPEALRSVWVNVERSSAQFRNPDTTGRGFIPVLLADCDLPDALRRCKYVDMRQPTQAAYKELVEACRPANFVRVLLADDHPIVRAGIREAVKELPGVQVVGEARDGPEAIELVKSARPDVVLMDISLPRLNGLEATERIINAFPKVRVIILSRHENEEYYWRALKVGASGYVLKRALIGELKAAIQRVAGGEIYLCREISNLLRKQRPSQRIAHARSPVKQLTARQREILQLIAEGETTKAIAPILKISPKTIEYQRMQLMQRLNIFDIPGMVRFAVRTGLVSQES